MFDRLKGMFGKKQTEDSDGVSLLPQAMDESDSESQQSLSPQQSTALKLLAEGRFETNNGSFTKAVDCFKKALLLDPELCDAFLGLADVYAKQGKEDEALDQFQRALTMEPNLPEAHYQMGRIYLKRKQVSKALAAFEKELAITPRHGRVHNDLAVAHFHQRNFEKAIYHCDRAVALGEVVHEKFLKALAPYRKR